MPTPHECLHEEQILGQSRKIESLETRANYKEDVIKELKTDIKELKESMDSLDKTINEYIIQSIKDDNTLKEYINSLENRVTSLESRQDTIYKLLIATPAIIALLGVIAIYINYINAIP